MHFSFELVTNYNAPDDFGGIKSGFGRPGKEGYQMLLKPRCRHGNAVPGHCLVGRKPLLYLRIKPEIVQAGYQPIIQKLDIFDWIDYCESSLQCGPKLLLLLPQFHVVVLVLREGAQLFLSRREQLLLILQV